MGRMKYTKIFEIRHFTRGIVRGRRARRMFEFYMAERTIPLGWDLNPTPNRINTLNPAIKDYLVAPVGFCEEAYQAWVKRVCEQPDD